MPVENLKKAAKVVAQIVMQSEDSFKDGFQLADLFSFIGVLSGIPDIIKNKQLIIDEYKNRTPLLMNELYLSFENDLNLDNKRVEAIAEKSLKFLIAGLDLVDEIRTKPITPLP